MTSEEIREKQPFDLSTNGWLREVALQLALLNEKKPEEPKKPIYDRSRPNQQRT